MGDEPDVLVDLYLTVGLLQMTTAQQQLAAITNGMASYGDNDSYVSCAQVTINDGQSLGQETYDAFAEAARSANYRGFCLRMQDWRQTAVGMEAAHRECPTPQSPHLQSARIWLSVGYSDCVESIEDFDSWCRRDQDGSTFVDCTIDPRCSSALDAVNAFGRCLEKAQAEVDAYMSR